MESLEEFTRKRQDADRREEAKERESLRKYQEAGEVIESHTRTRREKEIAQNYIRELRGESSEVGFKEIQRELKEKDELEARFIAEHGPYFPDDRIQGND